MAIPVYRNDEVDPKIEQLSGMELERKAGFDQMKVDFYGIRTPLANFRNCAPRSRKSRRVR